LKSIIWQQVQGLGAGIRWPLVVVEATMWWRRRRITDGPLGVIVVGQKVNSVCKFVEIYFIYVLNLKWSLTTWTYFAGTVGLVLNHYVGLKRGGDEVGVEVFAKFGVLGKTGKQCTSQRSEKWQNYCFSFNPTFFEF